MPNYINFRFKSEREFNKIEFDSPAITVKELKELIAKKMKMNNDKAPEKFELILSDEETGKGGKSNNCSKSE